MNHWLRRALWTWERLGRSASERGGGLGYGKSFLKDKELRPKRIELQLHLLDLLKHVRVITARRGALLVDGWGDIRSDVVLVGGVAGRGGGTWSIGSQGTVGIGAVLAGNLVDSNGIYCGCFVFLGKSGASAFSCQVIVDTLAEVSAGDLVRRVTTVGERVSSAVVLEDLAFVKVLLGNGTLANKVTWRAAEETRSARRIKTGGPPGGTSKYCSTWSRERNSCTRRETLSRDVGGGNLIRPGDTGCG